VESAYLQRDGLPDHGDMHTWVSETFEIDLRSEYAGLAIANPWGKASGQLSMTSHQVSEDVAAGLGFVVLKTVIAQSGDGQQSMSEWAIRESRMAVESIRSAHNEPGWTVSWKGRGWWDSFDAYLELVRSSRRLAEGRDTLIVPSVKYHLPGEGESGWLVSEYEYTTRAIANAWRRGDAEIAMPLEKDFSPTLAGNDRSQARDRVVAWMRKVPELVHGAVEGQRVLIGLKIFNALFDDDFQLELLESVMDARGDSRADFVVYGNRLFDPEREFDGHRGVAFGGPDLSDRNLRVLSRAYQRRGVPPLPVSATGNILCGRMAMEYALRGASSFQLHTGFQLPSECYRRVSGSRTEKTLHELYLHPEEGLVVWLVHVADRLGMRGGPIRFRDVVGQGPVAERA